MHQIEPRWTKLNFRKLKSRHFYLLFTNTKTIYKIHVKYWQHLIWKLFTGAKFLSLRGCSFPNLIRNVFIMSKFLSHHGRGYPNRGWNVFIMNKFLSYCGWKRPNRIRDVFTVSKKSLLHSPKQSRRVRNAFTVRKFLSPPGRKLSKHDGKVYSALKRSSNSTKQQQLIKLCRAHLTPGLRMKP